MKLSVKQENLAKAVNLVSRVANGKQLPILNNVLFRTDGNRLLVAGTNLEIAATEYIGTKIIKPGAVTVPAKLLNDFVNNLPKGKIDIELKGLKLHIKSETYNSVINCINANDFPELPTINESESIKYTILADDFKKAVTQTIVATSNDLTRPVLTGVYWHSFDGKLYLASTDGYRLAQRFLVPTDSDISAIVPTTTLQEVLRTINDDVNDIEILFDDTQVRFRSGEAEITSQLINGKFLPYQQIIPKNNDIAVELNKNEFIRTIKISDIFARESGGSITIEALEDESGVKISTIASEIGENESILKAKVKGAGKITLNARYISDALSVIDGDDIKLTFNNAISPCVLSTNEKESNYKHIIMPLKV